MPNSGVNITPGAGASIAVNTVGGLDYQVIKIDAGADGSSYPLIGDGTHGLPFQVTQVEGVVVVNNPTAANLKVDASGATVPISATSAIPVSAVNTAPVSVRLSNGSGNVDTIPISGTVTANQGTGAAASAPWPIEITDGTNGVVGVATVGGQKCVQVSVLAAVGAGAIVDKAAFTEGTTSFDAIGGEYNTGPTLPASGQAAACQITQYRGLHVNLRASGGGEIGTSGAPVRVDPTGTTTQPVNVGQVGGATVSVSNPMPAQLSLGNAAITAVSAGAGNPLPTLPQPTPTGFWKQWVGLTASQTAQAIHSPASGKTAYIEGILVTITTAGLLQVFDGTNSATTLLYQGTLPVGGILHITPTRPIPLSAINNVLRYTTGTAVGDLVAWGYDA